MENPLCGAAFLKPETKQLAEPKPNQALIDAMTKSIDVSLATCWSIPDWPKWRDAAHDVKAYTLANLDRLLAQFADNLEAKGVKVLWARDAEDANKIVLEIAKENNVKTVVKGKSMVSEEMELNKAFASNGIRALETDLGEFIVQLTGKRPTHIVTPATHLSAKEVGEVFHEKLGVPFTEQHEELTMIARHKLREEFISADMGMSGINIAMASTGSFCLVENEGNIGLSTTAPKIHVALMGIEKLIPGP
ncbi:MAG: lactate utilization protein, partial [Thermoguttaceae bacterium]|nr:lactate utilization protein [Thermoguttaceae bacterium]